MRIRVTHTLDDLHRDLEALPERQRVALSRLTDRVSLQGQQLAQRFARETSGAEGVHFPDSITREQAGPWHHVYGQDAALKQGNMNFEHGPGRQTSPHLPHAKSADIAGPLLGRGVRGVLDDLFWGS